MFIEKYKIIQEKSLFDDRLSLVEDNLEAVQQRKLINKSRKINELFNQRNIYEGKCLELKYLTLKRQHLKTDQKLDSKIMNVKKILKEINEKTKDDDADSIQNSLKIESQRIGLRLPSLKNEVKKQNEQRSECKFSSDSLSNDKLSFQFDRKSDTFKTKLSFNSTTNFSLPSILSCCLFPSILLKSYNSMIGPKNDQKTCLKSNDYFHFGLFEQSEREEQIKYYRENKSIRRSLRKNYSLKDFEMKIFGVETQAKFCKNINKSLRKLDRNIRYGE